MARRDSNSDAGKTRRNAQREDRMYDNPVKGAWSVQDDASLGGLAATRGAADIPQSPKKR